MVVFSDLHMGDGGPRDDFRFNAELVRSALHGYYLPKGFSLVLNGDIEELQRFRLPAIRSRWGDIFRLFAEFRRSTRYWSWHMPLRIGYRPVSKAARLGVQTSAVE